MFLDRRDFSFLSHRLSLCVKCRKIILVQDGCYMKSFVKAKLIVILKIDDHHDRSFNRKINVSGATLNCH